MEFTNESFGTKLLLRLGARVDTKLGSMSLCEDGVKRFSIIAIKLLTPLDGTAIPSKMVKPAAILIRLSLQCKGDVNKHF